MQSHSLWNSGQVNIMDTRIREEYPIYEKDYERIKKDFH